MPITLPAVQVTTAPTTADATVLKAHCKLIGRLALRSLYDELVGYPKPGLVSPVDAGSHKDMDHYTFFRSLFSLRHYFVRIALAGINRASFRELQIIGMAAERRMLLATRNINTHRGAVFSLGLLAAACGQIISRNESIGGNALGDEIRREWGTTIMSSASQYQSHGQSVNVRFEVGGAREEAAKGYPIVFGTGLPVLRQTLLHTGSPRLAYTQTLFSLMAELADTNVLYRGGVEGLNYVQRSAADFLKRGGVYQHDWGSQAIELHHQFVSRNLSPGGSADLLAATIFVQRMHQVWEG